MKKNYRKSAPEKNLLHVAAITVFAIAAVFACLVCAGFLKVRLPWADAGTERTKTPGELAYESYLSSLTTGRAPDTSSPETPEAPQPQAAEATVKRLNIPRSPI